MTAFCRRGQGLHAAHAYGGAGWGNRKKIESSDDNSGVEAVYIDKTRVNSLVDGKASVALKDYADTDKKSERLRGGLCREPF